MCKFKFLNFLLGPNRLGFTQKTSKKNILKPEKIIKVKKSVGKMFKPAGGAHKSDRP